MTRWRLFTGLGAAILLLFGLYLAMGAYIGSFFYSGFGPIRLKGVDVPGGTLTSAAGAIAVFAILSMIFARVSWANRAAAVIAATCGAIFLAVALSPSQVGAEPRDEFVLNVSPIFAFVAVALFLLGDKSLGRTPPAPQGAGGEAEGSAEPVGSGEGDGVGAG
jgi:hypothetical protein